MWRRFRNIRSLITIGGNEARMPEKPVIDDTPKDVIKYKERVFEVPTKTVLSLADLPENLDTRIKRTIENGMNFIYPDGIFSCHYCGYYSPHNVMVINNTRSAHREGRVGIYVRGCEYKRAEDVRWVTSFTQESSGKAVMAQRTPCVVYDSMIAQLIETGQLDEFEVEGREFDYPTIGDLIGMPELQQHYKLQPVDLLPPLLSSGKQDF